jgi:hypothetical protein
VTPKVTATPKPMVTPKPTVTPKATPKATNKPSIAPTIKSSKVTVNNLKPGQKIKVTVKIKVK